MNRYLSLSLLLASLCSAPAIAEMPESDAQAHDADDAHRQVIAIETLKLNNKVAELARQRLQLEDESLVSQMERNATSKLEQFAASNE